MIYRLRFLVIVSLFMVCFCMEAKTSIDEQRKLLKQHDLTEILPLNGKFKESPHLFWEYVRDHNKQYQEALKAAKSGKAKEIQRSIGEAIYEMKQSGHYDKYIPRISELLDSLKSKSGISELYPRESHLYLDFTEEINARAMPDGTILISLGLLKALDFDFNLLMGVYAHELTHFVLQHTFSHLYFSKKKAKKNKMLAAIFTGITVAAAGYADIQFASNDVETHTVDNAVQIGTGLKEATEKNTMTYVMKYNRELEYEADILAYRFLESIGIDGNYYIETLNRVKSDLEIFSNDESTHPLTEDRIALIEFMRTNPNLTPKPTTPSDDDIYYIESY